VVVWLLWVRHADRERYLRLRAGIPWAVIAYIAVGAPILWTAITDFNNYFARGASVLFVSPETSSPDSYPVHVLRTLGMFILTGDPNARHDVAALPMLGPVLFVPFAFGIWRAWRRRDDHAHAALLIGLVVFLLPPLVANEGPAPHFLRTLGLAPFVAALIGVGCLELYRAVSAIAARAAVWAVPGAVAATLVALGAVSTLTYLTRPLSARYDAYSFADVELAAAADSGPGTVAILDEYRAFDVRFLDYDRLPTVVAPGTRLHHAAVYTLIVASARSDIARATDAATAARATVVARDPGGRPVVWEVVP
jgi:hypothetical protein